MSAKLITIFFLLLSLPLQMARSSKQPMESKPSSWTHEERDHYRKERKYWLVSSIISGIALVAAAAGACFAYGAYLETRRQASISQETLDNSTRPWVLIENLIADSPMLMTADSVKLVVKAQIKNYAQLPALGISFSIWPLQVRPGFNYFETEAKKHCNQLRGNHVTESSIILPSSSKETMPSSATIDLDRNILFPSSGSAPRILRIALISCLNYAGLDGKMHQTVAYHLVSDKINSIFFNIDDSSVAADRLEFIEPMMFTNDVGQ